MSSSIVFVVASDISNHRKVPLLIIWGHSHDTGDAAGSLVVAPYDIYSDYVISNLTML